MKTRIAQHLNHELSNSYTSKANDWILFFALENLDYKQARLIETHIKKMRTRTYYQNLKTYPEISERLTDRKIQIIDDYLSVWVHHDRS